MQTFLPSQIIHILYLTFPILLASCQSIKTKSESFHPAPTSSPKPHEPFRATTKKNSINKPRPSPFFVQEGIASWYGGRWIGRKTSNGEIYKSTDITAAHRSLPFNTIVRVTDLRTNRSILVRINNRGPFIRGRIIDLSVAAAKHLGFYKRGLTKVKIEAYKPGSEPRP